MNKNELEKRLIEENIPKKEYSFTDAYPQDAFCLRYDEKGHVWEVILVNAAEKPA